VRGWAHNLQASRLWTSLREWTGFVIAKMIFIFSIDATQSHGYILLRASYFGDRSRNNSDGDCSRNNSDGDCSRNNSDGDISRVVKITEIILALKTTKNILVFCIAIVWHTSHANMYLMHPLALSSALLQSKSILCGLKKVRTHSCRARIHSRVIYTPRRTGLCPMPRLYLMHPFASSPASLQSKSILCGLKILRTHSCRAKKNLT
jgi:hypothetical protein